MLHSIRENSHSLERDPSSSTISIRNTAEKLQVQHQGNHA